MKTAIITGASTGIGRAIARKLARDGANTILVARSEDGLNQTKELIQSEGGTAEVIVSDLSSVDGINDLIERIQASHKQIDILINVAGIWHGNDVVFADTNYEDFDQKIITDTMYVGTLAPLLLAHAFIPLMLPNSKIVNISGTFANGAKGWLPYYVSKKAIEDFTVGLAEELKDKDIQVNCVSPADVATEAYKKHFPEYLNDAVEPEEVANQVSSLCLSSNDGITGKVFVVRKDREPYEGFHS